ncbi:MAG: hypothetical protein U9Q70_03735 [Chloroflexota bacterium]|nr:hypothetical protein [Chloroflexota bacterium]
MARRSKRKFKLYGAERPLFISGATLYVLGLFGGFNLLAMPTCTAIVLLALGGGLLLITLFFIIFSKR